MPLPSSWPLPISGLVISSSSAPGVAVITIGVPATMTVWTGAGPQAAAIVIKTRARPRTTITRLCANISPPN